MRGMGRTFQNERRGNGWYIAYMHRGKEVRESVSKYLRRHGMLRQATDKDAEKLLKKRLGEIAAESQGGKPFVGPQQDRVIVNELLDALESDLRIRRVRSMAGIQSHLKKVRAAFGDRRASEITTEVVDRYVETRLAETEAPAHATVNRETGLLGQAFKLALRRRRVGSAPMIRKLSEKGNARQGFFEKDVFSKLVDALPDYLKGYVQFAYHSGWRRGEVRSLLWVDVDMSERVIRLRPENSKTNEGRVLPLAGELWNIVSAQLATRQYEKRDKTIIVSRHVFHRKGEAIGEIRKSWTEACKAAECEGMLFHDLRRTFIRNAVRAGNPERIVMGISGHKTRAVFDRYNIVTEADIRQAVDRTQSYLNATSRPRSRRRERTTVRTAQQSR